MVLIYEVSVGVLFVGMFFNLTILILFAISLTSLTSIRLKNISNPVFLRLITIQLVSNLIFQGFSYDNTVNGRISARISCDNTRKIAGVFYVIARSNVFYFLIKRAQLVDVGNTKFTRWVYKLQWLLIVFYAGLLIGLAPRLFGASVVYTVESGQTFCTIGFSVTAFAIDEVIDLTAELLCLYLTQIPLKKLNQNAIQHVTDAKDQATTMEIKPVIQKSSSAGKLEVAATVDLEDKKRIARIKGVIRTNYQCAWISLLINVLVEIVSGAISAGVPDSIQHGQAKSFIFALGSFGSSIHVLWMIYLARNSWEYSTMKRWLYGTSGASTGGSGGSGASDGSGKPKSSSPEVKVGDLIPAQLKKP